MLPNLGRLHPHAVQPVRVAGDPAPWDEELMGVSTLERTSPPATRPSLRKCDGTNSFTRPTTTGRHS